MVRHPLERPSITADEFRECDEALREDARVVQALAARGITDLDETPFDVRAYGGSRIADRYGGMRVDWAGVWYRDHEDANPVGTADITAPSADGIVRGILGGIAPHRNRTKGQQKEEG